MADEHENNEFPPGEQGNHPHAEEQLDSGQPAVAAAPGKLLIFVVAAGVFVFIVIKSLFFGSAPKPVPPTHPQQIAAPTMPTNGGGVEGLPVAPTTNLPPITPPPPVQEASPPPQVLPPGPPPDMNVQVGPTNEQLKTRIHSAMLISGGMSGSSSSDTAAAKKKTLSSDPNSAFADNVAQSQTETIEATKIKNMNITLAQGKLISGVLETAIDSTLPGDVRAIVSHDVYAESGREVLIPKGSRIVGVYNSSVQRGQARVFIIWTRVIRPDGVDVAINSPGVDALGRAGMGGIVDSRFLDAFSTAILASTLDVGIAAVGQGLFGDQQQVTTTGPSSGSTTATSSPTSTAMQQAVQNIGTVGQTIVNSTVNLAPVIHVDQGEVINIFVNKDVVFPPELTGGPGFIP
ncbi:MAG TPA: TrbI/VirB10 family protein [Rickettsiales bacterium]|nr:TrbI/VirB10 family protein [Rickettsiales bacterium]